MLTTQLTIVQILLILPNCKNGGDKADIQQFLNKQTFSSPFPFMTRIICTIGAKILQIAVQNSIFANCEFLILQSPAQVEGM